jgi:crotonobetainyl-CoA:carnitine CoA-transferase CaiB-like acyl-CoA transferase
MARLGLDEATVRAGNPAIVYCSISGYGQSGARATLPGHDVNYQAWGGALTPEGGTAVLPPLPTADLAAGMTAAFAICAGVIARGTSGRGTYLDVAMTDVMATWTGPSGAGSPDPADTPSGPVPGYGVFPTAGGGQISLGVVNEQHFWSRLCAHLGLGELADLGFDERCRRGEDMQRAIAAAVAAHERDALVADLVAAGVPVAPVLDRQEMLASGPFPPFPVRLSLPATAGAVPALDQHRGEGFCDRA